MAYLIVMQGITFLALGLVLHGMATDNPVTTVIGQLIAFVMVVACLILALFKVS